MFAAAGPAFALIGASTCWTSNRASGRSPACSRSQSSSRRRVFFRASDSAGQRGPERYSMIPHAFRPSQGTGHTTAGPRGRCPLPPTAPGPRPETKCPGAVSTPGKLARAIRPGQLSVPASPLKLSHLPEFCPPKRAGACRCAKPFGPLDPTIAAVAFGSIPPRLTGAGWTQSYRAHRGVNIFFPAPI